MYSKTAPTHKSFEVEHDFLKTVLPIRILKRRRLVEFMVFNLLALAWLELAWLMIGLLGLVWFGLLCLLALHCLLLS